MLNQTTPSPVEPIETDEQDVKATIAPSLLAALHLLYAEMAPQFAHPLVIDYSSTDEGQKSAALCLEDPNRWGPLVSVLWGEGVPGVAVILGADGMPLCDVKTLGGLGMGMRIARASAYFEAGQTVAA